MNTDYRTPDYAARLTEAFRNPDTETDLGRAVARMRHPFQVGDGEKWLYEGFISAFSALFDALRAIDDSIPPGLPPHLLNPAWIAKAFRLRLEDFNWQGRPAPTLTCDASVRLEDKLDAATRDLGDRLSSIEGNLAALVQQHTIKEFYTTDDLCRMFGKAPYTVREWCRLGRIKAQKVPATRGGELEWRISHEELVRIQNEGLLPLPAKY